MRRRSFVGGTAIGSLMAGLPAFQAAGKAADQGAGSPRVIPMPRSIAAGPRSYDLGSAAGVSLVLPPDAGAQLRLAASLLETAIGRGAGARRVAVHRVPAGATIGKGRVAIHLVDSRNGSNLEEPIASRLDAADREALRDPSATGQAYVMRILPDREEAWLVGSGPQGVLYAATSLVQWMESEDGPHLREVHIRDYPDFRHRAASDWLLQAEANRWAYDRGDGRRAYIQRVKRKLDFCLLYKINMVVFDGFGWTSEKSPGYARMMRELNAYARERGIKLMYGGYGSNFQAALIRPEHNAGTIWYNRETYPHGAVYACFGEANPTYREGSPTGGLLGTCRGNEELNRLKAEEMRQFVRSVEPGAVYIHHEDVGNILRRGETGGDNNRLADWRTRCPRCQARWPNDDFLAKDGGCGAIAHGYRNLLEAVFSVKNPDTGYDARLHCTVILVSPGYSPSSTNEADWDAHLTFWANVVSLLPAEGNVEICFREVMPQRGSGRRWLDAFNRRLAGEGRSFPAFIFFLGGADLYLSRSLNYPYSPVAAMNGLFAGAETIYNFSGAAFQEPLQMLNSEFAWNVKAPGHRLPDTYEACLATWQAMIVNRDVPREIAGPGGFLEEACRKLYGRRAGAAMLRYFTFFRPQPRARDGSLMVPVAPERLYATPILWRMLELDRDSTATPSDPASRRWIDELHLSPSQWRERWSLLWLSYAEVNAGAVETVDAALRSPDLRADSREDVAYLKLCLAAARRFSALLAAYHRAAAGFPGSRAQRDEVLGMVNALSTFLEQNFRFDTVDPLGGDQASWLETLDYLRGRLLDPA